MSKQQAPDPIRSLVHTPSELMTDYVRWAEEQQGTAGVPFGLPVVDEKMVPMRPGNLTTIIGRPGHGKTSLLAYLAKEEARRIMQRGTNREEAVVYVTWEQSAQELTAFFLSGKEYSISDVAWGKVDLDVIRRQAVKGASIPIWVVGHGIYSRLGAKAPRMTPDVVYAAIESMEADFKVRPTLLLFDYLQLIPIDHARERVQQVTEAPIRIKELALRLSVPAVAGVQASREVDTRAEKLPEARDAQWASSIEQTSDKVFSLWRPWLTEEPGAVIKTESGNDYTVTESLLFLRMLKQRMARGRHTWALFFDPAMLRLAALETRYINGGAA